MAITSKPLSIKDYQRRIVEIGEILDSPFKVSEKDRKELLAKQQRYVEIVNQSKR